jgi:glycosyltransferase involved in cell wall biosynthesis
MASVKPKLLYILHNYFNRAGTEDHVKSLALGLASEFDIFILFPQQSEICLLHPDGRQERFQGALPVWPQTSYRIPAMNQTLAKVLELIRPDLIHIQHFLNWPLSILDQIAETRIPFALTLHDYYTITPYYTFEDVQDPEDCFRADYSLRVFKVDFSPYLTERRKLLSKSLSYAKAVIAPSQFLASAIQKIFPITIRVIEHGAYEFEPRMKTESQGDLRFGYLGGLIPQKGWDLLLTAFLEVNKTFHRTELHFYGAQNRSGQEFKNVFFSWDLREGIAS